MIHRTSLHFFKITEGRSKAVKFHLKRSIDKTFVTFEDLSLVRNQIEVILNSRQLIKISDSEIFSLNILTLSNFLIRDVITSLPDKENIMA